MAGLHFALGRVVATISALRMIERLEEFPYLRRHQSGDWGDISTEDCRANDQALRESTRIFSAYDTPAGRIWIITEADRSSTCILLPEDY